MSAINNTAIVAELVEPVTVQIPVAEPVTVQIPVSEPAPSEETCVEPETAGLEAITAVATFPSTPDPSRIDGPEVQGKTEKASATKKVKSEVDTFIAAIKSAAAFPHFVDSLIGDLMKTACGVYGLPFPNPTSDELAEYDGDARKALLEVQRQGFEHFKNDSNAFPRFCDQKFARENQPFLKQLGLEKPERAKKPKGEKTEEQLAKEAKEVKEMELFRMTGNGAVRAKMMKVVDTVKSKKITPALRTALATSFDQVDWVETQAEAISGNKALDNMSTKAIIRCTSAMTDEDALDRIFRRGRFLNPDKKPKKRVKLTEGAAPADNNTSA